MRLFAMLAAGLLSWQPAAADFTFRSAQAKALVQRARESLGGREALDRVLRLEFVHGNERTRIIFANGYRLDHAHGRTVFDGDRIRAFASDGRVTSDSSSRSNADVIRRRGKLNLEMYAIQYLLRSLAGGSAQTCGHRFGIEGAVCVEFDIGADHPVFVLIDRMSGRPVGFATRFAGSGEADGYWFREHGDYRKLQDVWLPHAVRSKRFNLDGTLRRASQELKYQSVRVNPPPESGDPVGKGR